MVFLMLDVLRHSGDRFVWDFRCMPSLTESCKRNGTSLLSASLNLCTKFLRGENSMTLLLNKYAPWTYLYWPECGYGGEARVPWFLMPTPVVAPTYQQIARRGSASAWAYVAAWVQRQWQKRPTFALSEDGVKLAWRGLTCAWHSVSRVVKYAGLAFVVWRCFCLLQSRRESWQERRTPFDGQDNIAFCAHCSPQLSDDNKMILGNAYEKRFHVPAACPRCSWLWAWKGKKAVRMRIGNSHYQFFGTYTALRMQRERDVHCPAVNQLDIPNEYRFAHRFMQQHGGTIGAMESKQTWYWSGHTRSYCLATQWNEIEGGEATIYQAPRQAATAAAPVAPVQAAAAPAAAAPAPATVPAAAPAPLPTPGGLAQALGPPAPVAAAAAPAAAAAATAYPAGTAKPAAAAPAGTAPAAPKGGVTTVNAHGGTLTVGGASGSGASPAVTTQAGPTHIQRMRDLWQFVHDNDRCFPQSTLISSPFTRSRELIGKKGNKVFDTTAHYRTGILGIGSRILDSRYMSPPPGIEMAPVARDTAQAVGALTHLATVHNAQDKVSVVAALEGRSNVKKSVFADETGAFPDLMFKKNSKAAHRLHKFWQKFNHWCLTDKAIDNAYHKLFAGKTFKEIAMSKFSQEDIEAIQIELQATTKAESLGTRKANGKLESVLKEGKPGRLVIDNTLQLLALNIISCSIFQHILFDEQDGIFYSMSIKHRPREEVLNDFAEMMKDPWGQKSKSAVKRVLKYIETCAWEIDQTGMELHERCNKHGEGLLGYTYNALLRINRRISHKINGEFTDLHEAKIVHDVKTGMHIRFRIKDPVVPKEVWFTAKFPDMYLDSGWALTSGVNFINELSGVFSSICENPEHLMAWNKETGKFRLQDGTFDWTFKSIPLYQSLTATELSSFDILLRGLFEGDDGGGAGSRCLADPRNGGKHGLIIREQENLGYSAKLKTIVDGRVEIIGAHFPVKNGFVCSDVPWIPAVQRYISKLGVQTNVNITPSSKAARFLSLASMFAGRNEPLQRGFELSAIRIINKHKKEKSFWTTKIKTDGYQEVDRAFGNGLHCSYTMEDVNAHYARCANIVHQSTQTQLRMLNMSIAEDVESNLVTQSDFAKLGLFADECGNFDGDDEAVYSFLPACLR